MASEYDGNINLGLGLKVNVKSVQETLNNLKSNFSSFFSSIGKKSGSADSSLGALEKSAESTSNAIKETANNIKQLDLSAIGTEFEGSKRAGVQAIKDTTVTYAGLVDLVKYYKRILATGLIPEEVTRNGRTRIIETRASLEDLQEFREMLGKTEAELSAFQTEFTKPIIPQESFAYLKNTLADLNRQISSGIGLDGIALTDEQIAELRLHAEEVGQSIKQIQEDTKPPAPPAEDETAFNKYIDSMKKGLAGVRKIANSVLNIFKALGSKALAGISSKLKSIGKQGVQSSKQITKGFKKAFITFLKFGLGLRGVFALIRRLRSAIVESLGEMAKQIPSFNTQMSSFKTALNQVKASLGTAFQPIASVILPLLTQFMGYLNTALEAVGKFFAVLTGQRIIYKATANQVDYANSLDKTAKAAKEAVGQLGAYDKLNVIGSDTNGGAGDGAGTSGLATYSPVEVDEASSTFAEMVKDAWNKSDFTLVGNTIGSKLNEALTNAQTYLIPKIDAFTQRFGTSLATLINGAVETQGLGNTIGSTLGGIINTGIHGITAFLDNTSWSSVGTFIGNGINGLVNTVDWANLGHLFAQKFNAIFTVVSTTVQTIDWSGLATKVSTGINTAFIDFDAPGAAQAVSNAVKGFLTVILTTLETVKWYLIGTKVQDFIAGIDWSGVTSALFEGLGAALSGLSVFLWGVIEDEWNAVIDWWYDVAFEDGKFVISGLLLGIWDLIKNIGLWIYNNIFLPFINGFNSAFKIGSPSKVMAEMGRFLVLGLQAGLTGVWDSVKNIFISLKNNITSSIQDTRNTMFNKFTEARVSVEGVFRTMKDNVVTVFNNLKNAIKTPINGIISFINAMISGITMGINGAINALNGLHINIPSWVPVYGGRSYNPRIPNVGAPQIPLLAQGAVIPPNRAFLAMLGDQRQGTNIEAPLDTIKQAVAEVLADMGGNDINLYLSGKQIAKVVWDESEKRYKQTGKYSFA